MDKDLLKEKGREREMKIVQALMDGKGPVAAVREAGLMLNENQANSLVESVKNKHFSANGAMLEALDRHGVNFDKLAAVYAKALDARKYVKVGKDEYMEVEDVATQLAAAEKMNDLVPGMTAPKKIEVETRTFEVKAKIIAEMKSNPEAAIEVIQRVLQSKRTES